jgi:hypothetical protein
MGFALDTSDWTTKRITIRCRHDHALIGDLLKSVKKWQPTTRPVGVPRTSHAVTMSNWLQLWVQTESRAELQVWLVEDRGVSEAKGELIAFLDDDELARANWLSGLVAGCMRHPDADVVGGWALPPPP